MREGDKGLAEEKERLRSYYERLYEYGSNKDFETWFARLTQTSKVESNSETNAQRAYMEMVLMKKDPTPKLINTELKGKNEVDFMLEVAANNKTDRSKKDWAKNALSPLYENLYKGKQKQTFEQWYNQLTSSDKIESDRALNEFREKIAMEKAIM
ncbi:hypothetical protein [Paenibacillus kribbensis]|uniref:Uncharacterized protein n=1 Tax=Paenibacillus kribbensis TaxID=172713 RepID=A0A222WRK7_9BACL|nr:hypothetical protein [Paenibacillus kribbensis]ASR48806.1 hypothetical protein B4V02_19950 [Paenibacillus kribbensis]